MFNKFISFGLAFIVLGIAISDTPPGFVLRMTVALPFVYAGAFDRKTVEPFVIHGATALHS